MQEKITFNAASIVFDLPLYEQVVLQGEEAWAFANLFNRSVCRIDGYCVHCKKESVFLSLPLASGRSVDIGDLNSICKAEFVCSRSSEHLILIFFDLKYSGKNSSHYLEFCKIGQKPTHADIANGNLGHLNKVLNGIDRTELAKANGLAAHGVNIGAFVYLRRVFERLIERASERHSPAIDLQTFRTLRMDEKITALSSSLPDFLVSNKSVYGLLSMGIHELDEAICGKIYEILRTSILMMLEQERALIEKRNQETELSKLISSVTNDFKKPA